MGPAIATGFCYGVLAKLTTDISPKAAFIYSVSNVAIEEAAISIGSELFAKTALGQLAKNIFVMGAAIGGGICVTNTLGHKIKRNDVVTLGISSVVVTFACAIIAAVGKSLIRP
ncbi:MAG: hypothetical protein H0U49_07435 [Parachlamydiaceae bacterium]|nr:hypothetical protein [Parachlamydiaceae bacterium]